MVVFLLAGGLSVFLSPSDACVSSIVREVRLAKDEIFVQATVATMPDVLDAFEAAMKRGVKVTVDTSHAGAGTTIIIDRRTVIAGSLRLEPRAVGSLFLVRGDSDIALKFSAAMVDHRDHAKAYARSMLVAADAAFCATCDDTKQATCARCEGLWKKLVSFEASCDKSSRVGCGGSGERTCFTCRGQVNQKCAKCSGKGYYKIGKRKVGSSNSKRIIYAGCIACGGRGQGFLETRRQTSKYSSTLVVRRGSGTVLCAKCSGTGNITCPRCSGTGKYMKRGFCPDCTKGKVPCRDCR